MGKLLDLLYPPRCPVCDGIRPVGEPVCHPECRKKLTPVGDAACVRCGKPVADDSAELCYDCAGRESAFSRGASAYVYEGELRESMVRFKFRGRAEYGTWYAREILRSHRETLAKWRADAVIPVPIHRRKLRERGYNQAELVADELAGELGLPLYRNYLRRNRYTVPQKELSNRERVRNLMRAMEPGRDAAMLAERKMTPERVILVDDIYTTGSTLEACSRVLKAAGVAGIFIVTVCIGSGYT